jgi:alpha-soluble NSF attachment protein
MADHELRARNFLAQAKSKENSWGFWNPDKWEQAAELYVQAGNTFKMAKNMREAGNAFMAASRCYQQSNSAYDAAQKMVEAGIALKKVDVNASKAAYQQGIEKFASAGRFSMAAKHQKELADMLEESGESKEALEMFQQAADLYENENQTSTALQCLLKVALLSAQQEDYPRAIEIYEQAAQKSASHNLLRWNVKDHLFRASLCYLAQGDAVGTKRALERYVDISPGFDREREYKLLQEILTAYDNMDPDAFTAAVSDYHNICKLDDWKTNILLKIKTSIKEADLLT